MVILKVSQVAKLLGVNRKTVYEAVANKEIPHQRLGKRILFSREAIAAWLFDPKMSLWRSNWMSYANRHIIGVANDKGVGHEIRAAEIAAEHIHGAATQLGWDVWVSMFEQAGWKNSATLHRYIGKLTKREQSEWDAGYLARQIVRHR